MSITTTQSLYAGDVPERCCDRKRAHVHSPAKGQKSVETPAIEEPKPKREKKKNVSKAKK